MALGDGGQTKKKSLPQQERATEEDGGVDGQPGRVYIWGRMIFIKSSILDILRYQPPFTYELTRFGHFEEPGGPLVMYPLYHMWSLCGFTTVKLYR